MTSKESEAAPGEGDVPSDFIDVTLTVVWFMVLASRPLYGKLDRFVSPEHLVRLVDLYIAYAARGDRYHKASFDPVPYERRVPAAMKLRALLGGWTPPELPDEIIEVARELLYTEGVALCWDELSPRIIDPDLLPWPEGIPAMMRSPEERARAKDWEQDPEASGDLSEIYNAWYWIMVLAGPPLYRTMKRTVDPSHLARLIEGYAAASERGARHLQPSFTPRTRVERAALARKLGALVAAWTPPDLPAEITEAARALLHAEGQEPPEGGWDAMAIDGPDPVEDILLWPEGVPALLRGRMQGRDPR